MEDGWLRLQAMVLSLVISLHCNKFTKLTSKIYKRFYIRNDFRYNVHEQEIKVIPIHVAISNE